MDNEGLLWSCTAFNGGIGAQQEAPCGGISAAAVCLGLRYMCPATDKERAIQARHDARADAAEVVKSFSERFGSIACRDLVGFDFTDTATLKRERESGEWGRKCDGFVGFVLEKLYEIDARRAVLPAGTETLEAGCS